MPSSVDTLLGEHTDETLRRVIGFSALDHASKQATK